MDEPTGNLDSTSEAEVLEHLLKIHARGKTIIIVTHNNELAQMAQYIYTIRDGQLESVKQNGNA
jgi:putative ABC transport system ATP-binding protein